jgi:two-component system CheB/CheR fusion protein
MGPTVRFLLAPYGVAVLAVAIALLARLALDPMVEDLVPFLPFALAVVAAARFGGLGPALLATALALPAVAYFFLSPRHDVAASLPANRVQVIGFCFLGVSIGAFSQAMWAARRRAEAHAREADRRRHELEQEAHRRKHLEQELQQRAEELAEADRRKDEFLAMLAHELRNPLAPIRHAAHVFRALGPAGPDLQQAGEMIERQVLHLSRLVDDLLDVSRITRGKIALHKEPVELAAVVARAVEACRPVVEARRHELTVTLPREPVAAHADATRMAQVVANLLNNAAKYTPEGGQVWLTVEAGPGEAVLRVRDNGVGMPADLLPRVFDLFTQGDRTLARSEGGLGIGLTLVKSLVEMHGGRVEAHSEGPGKGSELVVRLPTAEAGPGKGTGDGGRPGQPRSSRCVLVVDDNVDAAESLAILLRTQGHEVRTARDGPTALQEAGVFLPEVILLDIGLPRMDGYEVARRLREQEGLKKARLVALTGHGQEEDRRKAFEVGFDAHLVKPADLAELQEVLACGVSSEAN